MKNISIYTIVIIITGFLYTSNNLIAQGEFTPEVKKNEISLGWNYSYLSKWGIKSPYNFEFSYQRILKDNHWSVQAKYNYVYLCSQCDTQISLPGLPSPNPTIPSSVKPRDIFYNVFSLLLGYSFRQESKRNHLRVQLGPIYRRGYEDYFLGVSPAEIFDIARHAKDWGGVLNVNYEISLLTFLSLRLSGEYQLYLYNFNRETSDLQPPKQQLSAGAHLVFKI